MDVQFYGANCLVFSFKSARIVLDYDEAILGKKSVVKPNDVSLYTTPGTTDTASRLVFNSPGEYEIGDISISGIEAKAFKGDDEKVTMYKLSTFDVDMLVTGHITESLTAAQLETIGNIDVLFIPVGNSGYTLDPMGALKLIKDIEPKIVVPTNYKLPNLKYPVDQIDLDSAIKEMSMEPSQTLAKLKVKRSDLSEVTQLFVLEAI
jgi:L-ascorbate metabolism protein UlaG (beta-lactamase superfamily)